LREYHRFQFLLASPGVITVTNAMIAPVPRHRPIPHAPIKRFQKTMKCGAKEQHGRPQNRVWRLDFEAKT